MARRIPVDILQERGAKEVFVQLAYIIGYDQPLQATAIVDGEHEFIRGYDLSPKGIIDFLELKKPIYSNTAAFWSHKLALLGSNMNKLFDYLLLVFLIIIMILAFNHVQLEEELYIPPLPTLELDGRLEMDSNGYYHLELDDNRVQTIHTIKERLVILYIMMNQ